MEDYRQLVEVAQKTARAKPGFQVHLAAYIMGTCCFAITWLVAAGYSPDVFNWFMFPVGCWGIGVAIHFMVVHTRGNYLMTRADRESERLKSIR